MKLPIIAVLVVLNDSENEDKKPKLKFVVGIEKFFFRFGENLNDIIYDTIYFLRLHFLFDSIVC